MSIHPILIRTQDGKTVNFSAPEDQTILAAAEAVGCILPSICTSGGCGACQVTCAQGAYTMDPYSPGALSEEDLGRGGILLCRVHAKGPMVIDAPYPYDRITWGVQAARSARVMVADFIAERTFHLCLQLDPDAEGHRRIAFDPGQYVEVQIPETDQWRAYSMANNTNDDGWLELLIRIQPGGRFSQYLTQGLAVGQTLQVRGPSGHFAMRDQGTRPRWLVAGGTGLAPFLSMLRAMAHWSTFLGEMRLYVGANVPGELFFTNELSTLQGQLPNLKVVYCIGEASEELKAFHGNPAEALARDLPKGKETPDLYVCGPPALVEAVRKEAHRHGIPDDQVISEQFLPTGS